MNQRNHYYSHHSVQKAKGKSVQTVEISFRGRKRKEKYRQQIKNGDTVAIYKSYLGLVPYFFKNKKSHKPKKKFVQILNII